MNNCIDKIYNPISLESLHEHKNRQIDENRKISRRVDELENANNLYKSFFEKIVKLDNENDHHCEAITILERKVEKLEELNQKCFDENPIDQIDKNFRALETVCTDNLAAWNRLDERLCELEEITKRITEDDMKAGRQPHKCPVCEGSGYNKPELKIVDAKITIDGIECKAGNKVLWKSICNPCDGTGIVWG